MFCKMLQAQTKSEAKRQQPPSVAEVELYKGKSVTIWFKDDEHPYVATVGDVSKSEILLIYEDGSRKRYQREGWIMERILLGEVL